MRIRIEGTDLPGRSCGASTARQRGYHNIRVGVQRRNDPRTWLDLQPGDAEAVTWEFDATVTERVGGLDVLGPYVQGGRGQRFIYLSWGTVSATGDFEMFRRAKVVIADLEDGVLRAAAQSGLLIGRVGLTDAKGNPVCARLRAVSWSLE